MTISAILGNKGREVISLGREATLTEAVKLLAEKRIGAVPVIEGGQVLGIFSERDVIHAVASRGAGALDARVGELMTSPAITVEPEQPVMGALSMMTRRRVRHLPVLAGGKIVGMVSIGDLVKYRIDKIESEAIAMRDYIQSA